MLLPTTYTATLLTLALGALLWGLWANTLTMDRKWRFELYAFDFGFGALLITLLLALTVGNSGASNSFTFEDNLMVSSKKSMAIALSGGVIFCLGNTMVMAGVTLAGLSTALPVGAGMALLTAIVWGAIGGNPANLGLVLGGAGAALAAVVMGGMGQSAASKATPMKKGMHPGLKGFILSAVGGMIAGVALPVVELSRGGDIGLGSYGAAVFMAAGIVAMTPLVTLYFLNLPVQGAAGSPLGYLKGTIKQHFLGLAGGAIWGSGAITLLSAAGVAFAGAPQFMGMEAVMYGGAAVGGLCGLTVWGEQAVAPKAKGMLLGTIVLLLAGVVLTFLGA